MERALPNVPTTTRPLLTGSNRLRMPAADCAVSGCCVGIPQITWPCSPDGSAPVVIDRQEHFCHRSPAPVVPNASSAPRPVEPPPSGVRQQKEPGKLEEEHGLTRSPAPWIGIASPSTATCAPSRAACHKHHLQIY